ncbi:MAG: hypothetical protein ACOC3Z_00555 [Nanoarchaeota archaeon]
MKNTILTKALELIRDNKVIYLGKNWYSVNNKYSVLFDGSKISCCCTYESLHGVTKGYLCKHKIAVIIYASKIIGLKNELQTK